MSDDYQTKYGALTHEQLYKQLMAGDPDQVDAVAAKISSLRDTLGSLHDSLQTDLAGLAKGWSSDAGVEYQHRLGVIGTFAADLHTDLDSVHTTLTGWSGLLREAKKHAENPADTDGNSNTIKDAAIGAAAGSPLGPLGMAAGGLIGGFMGHNQDEEERQKAHERMITLVANLAADYVTSDRMPSDAAQAGTDLPIGSTGAMPTGSLGQTTQTPTSVRPTGDGSVPGQPVVEPTTTDGVTSLAGAGDQVGGVGGGDSLAAGGVPGITGGGLLSPAALAAGGLGVAAVGLGALGANGLPLTGASLANAEASGGVGRPGNLFSGVRGDGVDEGALGINRGTGGAAAARNAGEDEDEEHSTWLTEDEMVWGDDQPNAPAVLGGEPSAEPTAPRQARPRPTDQEGED
jgi:hypothetical protein